MDATSNRQPAANASVVHVAVDLAKDVFELAFADADHRIVERKRRSRGAFARYFDNRAPLRIIMEACASSGNTRRLGRITKAGDPYLRSLLVMGARAVLALAMVACNMREVHWGWPLAIISSVMYFTLFWRSKLYGEASLQVFFVVVAFWGWFQWLRGRSADGAALHVARLSRRGLMATLLASAVLYAAAHEYFADNRRDAKLLAGLGGGGAGAA